MEKEYGRTERQTEKKENQQKKSHDTIVPCCVRVFCELFYSGKYPG